MPNRKITCVIPARLSSQRFPEKILTNLLDKPLLQWTFDSASKVEIFDKVVFAIDSKKTASLLKTFNAPYIMTSSNCVSGTHRVIEVMQSGKIQSDIWVNWQADEPLIKPEMINELLNGDADIWTLKKEITSFVEINNPNIVKVVCDAKDNAMYFSRNPIPFYRSNKDLSCKDQSYKDQSCKDRKYFKHIGLYAFTTKSLNLISKMPACYLEDAEMLEQLRFLYYGLSIKTHETKHEVFGIDTVEDLINIEKMVTYV